MCSTNNSTSHGFFFDLPKIRNKMAREHKKLIIYKLQFHFMPPKDIRSPCNQPAKQLQYRYSSTDS